MSGLICFIYDGADDFCFAGRIYRPKTDDDARKNAHKYGRGHEFCAVSYDSKLLQGIWMARGSFWDQYYRKYSHVCALGVWAHAPVEEKKEYRERAALYGFPAHYDRVFSTVY